jgi:hypothetical protein
MGVWCVTRNKRAEMLTQEDKEEEEEAGRRQEGRQHHSRSVNPSVISRASLGAVQSRILSKVALPVR